MRPSSSWRLHASAVFAFLSAAVVSPVALTAAPLTFDEAITRAVETAPTLQAEVLGLAAARSAARSADALPDPKLTLGLDNFPVSGPPAWSFDRDSMTMGRIGVMQEFPNAAKLSARLLRANAEIDAAAADKGVQARYVRIGTALAWIDLAYAERRLVAVNGVLSQLGPLLATAPSSVASGSARPAEALDAERSRTELEDRRSEIVAEVSRARAELARWTGDPSPQVLGDPPAFTIDPASLRAALERHPTLRALAASAFEAEAEVALARAEKRPDWSLELAYQRRDAEFGDMVSVGVTIDLPLFPARRQDPMIAAKVAEAGKAFAEQEAARRALAAELDAALADYAMRHDQWMRSRRMLLPLAERQVKLETASYAAGTAVLTDVLRAHVGLADARLTTLDREVAVVRGAARLMLNYASAEP